MPISPHDLLVAAVRARSLLEMQTALRNGADPNSPAQDGSYPLHDALAHQRYSAWTSLHDETTSVRMLIDHGADPHRLDAQARTVLAYTHRRAILDLVYRPGMDLTVTDGHLPLLHRAVHHNDPDAVRFLIEHGVPLNMADKDGDFPLHWACECPGMTSLLLSLGADPNARGAQGATPLHWAASVDDNVGTVVIAHLLAAGAQADALDDDGESPLHEAVFSMRWASLKLLAQAAPTSLFLSVEKSSRTSDHGNVAEILETVRMIRMEQERTLLIVASIDPASVRSPARL